MVNDQNAGHNPSPEQTIETVEHISNIDCQVSDDASGAAAMIDASTAPLDIAGDGASPARQHFFVIAIASSPNIHGQQVASPAPQQPRLLKQQPLITDGTERARRRLAAVAREKRLAAEKEARRKAEEEEDRRLEEEAVAAEHGASPDKSDASVGSENHENVSEELSSVVKRRKVKQKKSTSPGKQIGLSSLAEEARLRQLRREVERLGRYQRENVEREAREAEELAMKLREHSSSSSAAQTATLDITHHQQKLLRPAMERGQER